MKNLLKKIEQSKMIIGVLLIFGLIGVFTAQTYAQCPSSAGILTIPKTMCAGDVAILFSTESDGTWTSSNQAIATIKKDTLHVIAQGQVTITYSIAKAECVAVSAVDTVQVKSKPNAGSIGTDVFVCKDATVTLTSDGDTGGTWITLADSIASIADESIGSIKGIANGVTTVGYVVDLNGCHDTTLVAFTVDTIPSLTLVGSDKVCLNSTISLSASSPGKTNVSWTSSDQTAVSVDSNGVVTGNSLGVTAQITYQATYGGCGNFTFNPHSITVMPVANAGTISSILPGNKLCGGNTTALAIANNDSGGTWSSSDTLLAIVNPLTGFVTTKNVPRDTTVKIRYTVFLGDCPSTSELTLLIDASPQPGVLTGPEVMEVHGVSMFYSSGAVGGNTAWSSSNSSVAEINATTGLVKANSVGTTTIKYTVTSTIGCGTTFAELPLSVTVATPDIPTPPSVTPPPLGLEELSISNIYVFPNPTTETITISYELLQADDEIYIQLVDINGKVIESRNVYTTNGVNTETFNVTNYANGIYTVLLQTANSSARVKLIKQ